MKEAKSYLIGATGKQVVHNNIFVFLAVGFTVFLASFIVYRVVVVDRGSRVHVDKPSFWIEIMDLGIFEACW
jgi:hypothetical protein